MATHLFWLAFSFAIPLAAALMLSKEKRSVPFYFVLLLALFVLFGPPAVPGVALALAWRYSQASRKL